MFACRAHALKVPQLLHSIRQHSLQSCIFRGKKNPSSISRRACAIRKEREKTGDTKSRQTRIQILKEVGLCFDFSTLAAVTFLLLTLYCTSTDTLYENVLCGARVVWSTYEVPCLQLACHGFSLVLIYLFIIKFFFPLSAPPPLPIFNLDQPRKRFSNDFGLYNHTHTQHLYTTNLWG